MDKKSDIKNLPLLLMILDGWGIAPPSKGNAITSSKTPNMELFMKRYPTTALQSSGPMVGLRFGEMGNSEVGHANIGAGRVAYQSLPRISKAIADGSFFRNEALVAAMSRCSRKKKKKHLFGGEDSTPLPRLHLMGILSESGVHGHMEHLFALLVMAKEMSVKEVFVHAFLDGRDSPYNSGKGYVEKIEQSMKAIGVGKIATMSGRFYAMDRDNRWERIERAYNAIVMGESETRAFSPSSAVDASYAKEIYDEEFLPTVITDEDESPRGVVQNGDSVIFYNYRADRARELTSALVLPEINGFQRKKILREIHFVCMMEYEKDLPAFVAYRPEVFKNTIGELFSRMGLRQLRIAETEKYAHVTFFLNGLSEQVFPQEEHILIPSPKVTTYDKTPAMSAKELTQRVIKELSADNADVIVLNFANADMVGHTGDRFAAIKAVETLDKCVGELVEVVLVKNGVCAITADHGNAEEMLNLQTGEMDKEHSTNPVPFIVIGKEFEGKTFTGKGEQSHDMDLLTPQGVLSDVAPTLLHILGIPQPTEMTGVSLL